VAALAGLVVAGAAFGALGTGGLTFVAVVFAGVAVTGGGIDGGTLVVTAPRAPPFAAGFTTGAVVLPAATFAGGGETDAPVGFVGADLSCARFSAGGADDDEATLFFGAGREFSDCGCDDDDKREPCD
jgi:hypothetical protein